MNTYATVKIDKKDKDLVQLTCIEGAVKVEFFTIEENENLLLAMFNVPDPGMLFVVGRMIELKRQLV
jgi:hypothetical protein